MQPVRPLEAGAFAACRCKLSAVSSQASCRCHRSLAYRKWFTARPTLPASNHSVAADSERLSMHTTSKRLRTSEGAQARPRISASSSSHQDYGAAQAVSSSDKPTTVQGLREARLRYIDTPPDDRKMKYEYVKSVPVKVTPSRSTRRTSGASEDGHTHSRHRRRRKRRSSHRSDERVRKSDNDEEEDDDAQYVYTSTSRNARKSRSQRDEPNDRAKAHPRHNRRESGTWKERRQSTVRRHTAPILGTDEAQCSSRPRTSPVEPEMQKSRSATSETRPPLRRSATSTRARTEVSVTPSTYSDTRRSVFGSFFAVKSAPAEVKVSCLTCAEEIPRSKSAKLPCTHRMCHTCLKRIFKMSVNDPAHMPPRCCTDQHIDLKHVDALFDQDFKKIWNRKFKEYKSKNRVYCPRQGCGEWIQPKHMTVDKGRRVGKCPTCKTMVCGICCQKMHKSKECPQDPSTIKFVETAKEAGWKKCYSCSAMVELKEGCNHMTCRCTAEFCMVCGLKWKSCDCPWFSYAAVDVDGDPVGYQRELDRRREQERRDAEMAQRMEALDVAANDQEGAFFRLGNAAGHHLNQNFVQQAHEALTARWELGHNVARGLLNGFFMGRENPLPGPEAIPVVHTLDEQGQILPDRPQPQPRPVAVPDPAEETRAVPRVRPGAPPTRPSVRRARTEAPEVAQYQVQHQAQQQAQPRASARALARAPAPAPAPAQAHIPLPTPLPLLEEVDLFEQRHESATERAQARRIRAWANDIASGP